MSFYSITGEPRIPYSLIGETSNSVMSERLNGAKEAFRFRREPIAKVQFDKRKKSLETYESKDFFDCWERMLDKRTLDRSHPYAEKGKIH